MRALIGSTVSTVLMAAAASAEAPKGGGAVQDTQALQVPAFKPDDLDKKDLKAAYKAIDSAYTIQWGKDGILELEGKLEGLRGKVGEHVFDVAKVAFERCKGALVVARQYFLALCEQAENHIQAKYIEQFKEEKPIGQLIPMWSQYKSSIAKGMERGIDPMERREDTDSLKYPTAATYRAAVQEIEAKERSTGSQAGNDRNSQSETTNQLQLVVKGWSPALSAAFAVLMPEMNRLTHEEQDKFVPLVIDLAAKVKTAADKAHRDAADSSSDFNRRDMPEVDPGTKAALQAAIDEEQKKDENKEEKKTRRGARAA